LKSVELEKLEAGAMLPLAFAAKASKDLGLFPLSTQMRPVESGAMVVAVDKPVDVPAIVLVAVVEPSANTAISPKLATYTLPLRSTAMPGSQLTKGGGMLKVLMGFRLANPAGYSLTVSCP
jgi:hypothetical protein